MERLFGEWGKEYAWSKFLLSFDNGREEGRREVHYGRGFAGAGHLIYKVGNRPKPSRRAPVASKAIAESTGHQRALAKAIAICREYHSHAMKGFGQDSSPTWRNPCMCSATVISGPAIFSGSYSVYLVRIIFHSVA